MDAMTTLIRNNQVLPDTLEQELLNLWPTLPVEGQDFLLKLFDTLLPADAPLRGVLQELDDARAFAQALANTNADPEGVDLQYAQASEAILAQDWLDAKESEDWQALPEVT
jgi:hypothetical protein